MESSRYLGSNQIVEESERRRCTRSAGFQVLPTGATGLQHQHQRQERNTAQKSSRVPERKAGSYRTFRMMGAVAASSLSSCSLLLLLLLLLLLNCFGASALFLRCCHRTSAKTTAALAPHEVHWRCHRVGPAPGPRIAVRRR